MIKLRLKRTQEIKAYLANPARGYCCKGYITINKVYVNWLVQRIEKLEAELEKGQGKE